MKILGVLARASFLLLMLAISGCAGSRNTISSSADAGPTTQQSAGTSSEPSTPTSEAYKLSPGDVIDVSVFQVPDLSRKVQVDNAGFISLPLVKSVHVGGMTIHQAEDELTKRLAKSYLRSPQVSLSLSKSGQRVTINGAVKAPKVISLDEALTLSQAVAQAGGYTETANGERVHVARVESGRVRDLVINLDRVQAGQAEDPNLKAGDIVIVEESTGKIAFKTIKELAPFTAIGGAVLMSDVRVKRDIRLLTRLAGGIQLYRFKYIWSETVYVGVLAQEVEQVVPEAVVRGSDGLLRVNYTALGLQMETCESWMTKRSGDTRAASCL